MKKVYYLILSIALFSCGSDDNVDRSTIEIDQAFKRVEQNIIGVWQMDAYHSISSSVNPYVNLGWEEEIWPFQNSSYFQYEFKKNGTVVDMSGKEMVYRFWKDYSRNAYYSSNQSGSLYYPHKSGAVLLQINDNYNTTYYIEIGSDNKMYLYITVASAGGDGVGHYRYKKVS